MRGDILKRVADLPGMSVAELKKMWQELCQSEPPPYNKAFLVKRLAYRIQELAMIGLTERTEKRLERLADEDAAPQEKKRMPGERLLPGTRLVRMWKGAEHPVGRTVPHRAGAVAAIAGGAGGCEQSGGGGAFAGRWVEEPAGGTGTG
ncbi:MAG: DUF2924 domain-containing protein [Magnetococcales bacterium]|nr:DUF2924 domain-containing protein [Magnetococcales bacterium]